MPAPVKRPRTTRPYASTVRDEGARQTRRAISAAAATLFVRDGYAATSLAAIAQEAGCARPTVFAVFGSKSALLKQVLDEALAGDDEAIPVAQRPWFQPVWTARTIDELSEAYADVCLAIGRRAAAVFEAVRRAVDADHEIRDLWQDVVRNRRAGARMIVDRATEISGSPPVLGLEEAVDLVWFGNDPAHYAALVEGCGWSEATFRAWLSTQFASALDPASAGGSRPAVGRARRRRRDDR